MKNPKINRKWVYKVNLSRLDPPDVKNSRFCEHNIQQIIKKLKLLEDIRENCKQKLSFDNTIGLMDLLPFKENKFEVLVCVF